MSQEQAPLEETLPTDGLGPSCTRGARSYADAEQTANIDLAWELEFTPLPELDGSEKSPLHDVESMPPSKRSHSLFGCDIDSNDSVWVPTGADSPRVYCGFAPAQWGSIEDACLTGKSEEGWREAVTEFLKQFRDWKYQSLSQRSCRHEGIFAKFLGTTSNIRGYEDDEDGREDLLASATDSEVEIARRIRELSLELAKAYDLFSCPVYRGLGHHLRTFAEEVFTDPSQERYLSEEQFTVLTNFSLDREIATEFSEIVLEVELSEDVLVTAPDFLTHTVVYYHDPAEWRPVAEAELRIRGDALTDLSREQLTIGRGSEQQDTLPDLVSKIPRSVVEYDLETAPLFTTEQHLAIREAALSFATYEFSDDGHIEDVAADPPESPEALDRLSVWLDIFVEEFNPDEPVEPTIPQVQRIVEQILEDGRS